MGWRASTLKDLIVVVLVRHGPHTVRQLAERISQPPYFEEWQLVYKLDGRGTWAQSYWGDVPLEDGTTVRGRVKGPAPLDYTDLHQRLKSLEKQGKVVQHGRDRNAWNAYVWHPVTREDKERAHAKLVERLRIPGELREQAAAAAAKIGCTVEFEVEVEVGYITMTTPRGPVVVEGPPEQSWWDAAIELGLAG